MTMKGSVAGDEEENSNQSSFAKASEDTPGSNDFGRLTGVSHPKLEERRVVGDDRLELPTLSV